MDSTNETIGERIKFLRKEKKLSQEELGTAIGLTQNNISKMENGDVSLTIDNLLLIASFFNVSTDYICTGQKNDNILNTLERYIYVEYKSGSCGQEHYNYPILKINKLYFEYLIRIACAKNDRMIPEEIKKMWIDKEIQDFNRSRSSDSFNDYMETIPVPIDYFYPDEEKSNLKQSDLIKEMDRFFSDNLLSRKE